MMGNAATIAKFATVQPVVTRNCFHFGNSSECLTIATNEDYSVVKNKNSRTNFISCKENFYNCFLQQPHKEAKQ